MSTQQELDVPSRGPDALRLLCLVVFSCERGQQFFRFDFVMLGKVLSMSESLGNTVVP